MAKIKEKTIQQSKLGVVWERGSNDFLQKKN